MKCPRCDSVSYISWDYATAVLHECTDCGHAWSDREVTLAENYTKLKAQLNTAADVEGMLMQERDELQAEVQELKEKLHTAENEKLGLLREVTEMIGYCS